jgi:hypothetical protein
MMIRLRGTRIGLSRRKSWILLEDYKRYALKNEIVFLCNGCVSSGLKTIRGSWGHSFLLVL